MLSKEQQQEILAFALLALALFLLLALLPASIFGVGAAEWFPSGNIMGVVGGWIHSGLFGWFGGSAVFIPILVLVAGLWTGEWLSAEWATRLGVLAAGLGLLLPIGFHVVGQGVDLAGAYGAWVGPPLVTALGLFGAVLLLSLLLIVLSVGTLGWNPARSVASGVAQGGEAVASGARRSRVFGGWLRARWDASAAALAEKRAARAALKASSSSAEPEKPFQGGEVMVTDPEEPPPTAKRDQTKTEGSVEADRDEGRETDEGFEDSEPEDPTDVGELSESGLPGLDFMAGADRTDREEMEAELDELGEVLVEKLRTFNVQSELAGRTTGPVVTQYEVVPAPGVKVNKIANLDADLALAMKAHAIRIVAPIPGKGAVGVEIPNPEPEVVRLREILQSSAYQRSRADLPLALGKDLTGKPLVADLRKMPHLLIAGATGSGKSVCINTIVTSLVCRHTKETLRLLMVDPKMVELSSYGDLPHLRHNVVTDPRDAASVLKWAVFEMERRYALLSQNGVRSIGEFNDRVSEGVTLRRAEPVGKEEDPDRWLYQEGILPYVVVVVDELADLMMTVQSEVEKPLTLLAQKARAIGIHLIVATQRPSVNVITGLIKANFPARIAFRVASKTDSRTILDQNGADALLGNGDMLFLPPGKNEPIRVQGAFISTEETDRMMTWYREQRDIMSMLREAEEEAAAEAEADILEEIRSHELEEAAEAALGGEGAGDWDELFRAAAEVCIQHEQGSTSLLQRRLKIGYGRAARIVDQLHDAGVLGPSEGSKAREVLIGADELDAICGTHGL
jgi:S-DNA-T family DNA segregation ATPase FtsK/SpoIIIE